MDLAFAIDTSDSLSQEDFEAQKGAIIMLAKSFGLSRQGTHTSVIIYGSDARVAIKLGDHVTIDEFSAAVQKLSHTGGSTRIDKALLMASTHVFSPENGGRSGMPKMLIIMTDGQQTSAPDAVPLEEAVAPLRLNGVKVVSVAIGNEVDEYELLALSELRDNIFRIQSFDTLYDTVTEVGQSLCLKASKFVEANCIFYVYIIRLLWKAICKQFVCLSVCLSGLSNLSSKIIKFVKMNL